MSIDVPVQVVGAPCILHGLHKPSVANQFTYEPSDQSSAVSGLCTHAGSFRLETEPVAASSQSKHVSCLDSNTVAQSASGLLASDSLLKNFRYRSASPSQHRHPQYFEMSPRLPRGSNAGTPTCQAIPASRHTHDHPAMCAMRQDSHSAGAPPWTPPVIIHPTSVEPSACCEDSAVHPAAFAGQCHEHHGSHQRKTVGVPVAVKVEVQQLNSSKQATTPPTSTCMALRSACTTPIGAAQQPIAETNHIMHRRCSHSPSVRIRQRARSHETPPRPSRTNGDKPFVWATARSDAAPSVCDLRQTGSSVPLAEDDGEDSMGLQVNALRQEIAVQWRAFAAQVDAMRTELLVQQSTLSKALAEETSALRREVALSLCKEREARQGDEADIRSAVACLQDNVQQQIRDVAHMLNIRLQHKSTFTEGAQSAKGDGCTGGQDIPQYHTMDIGDTPEKRVNEASIPQTMRPVASDESISIAHTVPILGYSVENGCGQLASCVAAQTAALRKEIDDRLKATEVQRDDLRDHLAASQKRLQDYLVSRIEANTASVYDTVDQRLEACKATLNKEVNLCVCKLIGQVEELRRCHVNEAALLAVRPFSDRETATDS